MTPSCRNDITKILILMNWFFVAKYGCFAMVFWLGNFLCSLAQVPFSNLMCIILWRKKSCFNHILADLSSILTKYNILQNMKKKWHYFHMFANLWKLGYLIGELRDKQRMTSQYQNYSNMHPLYFDLWRFDFSSILSINWLKLGANILPYQIYDIFHTWF